MPCIKIFDCRLTILDFVLINEISAFRGLKLLQSKIVNQQSEIILSSKHQMIPF